MEEILRLFPADLANKIKQQVGNRWNDLEEIRCRLLQPIELVFNQKVEWIFHVIPDEQIGGYLLNQISQYSLYRLENELREGYITIEGGHRIGIAGKVNTRGGSVKAIQHISFFNIRIAKERIGIARRVIENLYKEKYVNTLIVGPPQSGKTTMIRDIARIISNGWEGHPPKKVAIIDERSEIAASIDGVPQHQVGIRTDVMDACPKAEGMMMMIRSMSPEILVVDEIGSQADLDALLEAIHAGVTIICSIHGDDIADLKKRLNLRHIFETNVFERFLTLTRKHQFKQSMELRDKEGVKLTAY